MPQKELDTNLLELEIINRWLGGYAVSFEGFRQLQLPTDRVVTVADVGCGGGDGMIAIHNFCQKLGVRVQMIGVDANPKAIEYARHRCREYPEFTWITSPFQNLNLLEVDVFHCSLFVHHFYENDLTHLAQLFSKARIGFVVNDLHRHWLAYYSISLLTQLFSRSYLVQHDARLSVAKGFSGTEIGAVFNRSPSFKMKISWKWAFRWLVTGRKNPEHEG